MSVKLTNIKVSISTNSISLDSVEKHLKELNSNFKRYNNFIVIRDLFVYTLFRVGKNNLNHLNITKIKNIDEIEKVLCNLENLGFKIIRNSLKIDNITGSYDLKKEIFLGKVVEKINQEEKFKTIKVSYNNEKFPGLFLKVKEVGTVILFFSGKTVFVGCKSFENLECLASLTRVLTEMR